MMHEGRGDERPNTYTQSLSSLLLPSSHHIPSRHSFGTPVSSFDFVPREDEGARVLAPDRYRRSLSAEVQSIVASLG